MGVIKQGLLGGVSGKVGNVVGANWKGIDYLRILPANIANPKTAKQLNQRTKFIRVIRFLQPLTEFIRIGFKAYAVRMSAFNAAMSYNFHHAVTGQYPDYEIDYSQALVSRGRLTGAVNAAAASSQAGIVSLSWDDNSGEGTAQSGDTAMAALYNPAKDEAVLVHEAGTRADASADVEVPPSWSGDEVQVFIAFSLLGSLMGSGGKKAISDSAWAGAVTVS